MLPNFLLKLHETSSNSRNVCSNMTISYPDWAPLESLELLFENGFLSELDEVSVSATLSNVETRAEGTIKSADIAEITGSFTSGTMFLYDSEDALRDDHPRVHGYMEFHSNLLSAYKTHQLVRESVTREFQMEEWFKFSPPASRKSKTKKRRHPHDCEWKPESVYKTFVDCKPDYFDRSNYQDFVPRSLCFGKINMRIPKAWSRGPNRPKRRRQRPNNSLPRKRASYSDGAEFLTSFPPEPLSKPSSTHLMDECFLLDFSIYEERVHHTNFGLPGSMEC